MSAERPGPTWEHPITFRASGRGLVMRSLILFIMVGIGASLMGLRFGEVLVFAAFVTLAQLGLAYWIRIANHGVRLDVRGIRRLDPREGAFIAWEDVRSLDLAETAIEIRGRPVRLRYIVVEGRDGQYVLFSDLSVMGSPRIRIEIGGPQPIADVQDSGVLLALVADRIGDDRYLPDLLVDRARAVPADAAGGPGQEMPAPPAERRQVSVASLLALVAKIGSKLAKGIPAALKTFKPGLALASGAAFSIVFSWQFAVLIMVMLAFHEYGHVHAMRRSGMKVRGIYFIPLLGAAAVTEDTWRTRAEQAYIALSGPLWGLALTAVAVVVDAATGFGHPLFGVAIGWWSLINLFNLLPVNPLDGGRVLTAIGHSVGSRLGLAVTVLMIVAALVLAAVFGITLFAIIGGIGLLEFAAEAAATARARHVDSSPRVAALSPAGLATLKGLARPSLGDDADQAYFQLEMRNASRLRRMATVRPMTWKQALGWGIALLVVTAAFVGLLLVSGSAHPDAALARDVFR